MVKHSTVFDIHSPKWKLFNIPSKKQVQYSVIAGMKRDFQQTKEMLSTQVFSNVKISSCCIIDENLWDSSQNGKNMDIVIFDEKVDNCQYNCLSVKVFFYGQHLYKKLNNLLIFLKKLKGNIIYELRSANMYVKCEHASRWELFYRLFEFLLKLTSKGIIGAQFYCPLISKYLMLKELYILENKCCTNHKMIRKCKSNGVSRSQYLSNFNSEKSNSQVMKSLTITETISERQFKVGNCSNYELEKNSNIKLCNINLKRKFTGIHSNQSKILKPNDYCKCHQSKWKCFKYFGKFNIYNYTDILQTKCLLVNAQTTHLPKETCIYSSKMSPIDSLQLNSIPVPISFKKNFVLTTNLDTNEDPSLVKDSPSVFEKNEVRFDAAKCINDKGMINICPSEETDITVSEINNKGIMMNSTRFSKDLINLDFESHSCFSDDIENRKHLQRKKIEDENKMSDTSKSSLDKNFCEASLKFVTFQTASGKSLNVSKNALQIARSMYEEICSQVIDTSKKEHNTFTDLQEKSENDSNYKIISCQSKDFSNKGYFNEEVDSALTEKFFEEICFDENECKSIEHNSSALVQTDTIKKTSQLGKVRKSLGGRRSLKPYACKR